MLFKASAPGSLMLLGEYAVLHGKHALVCAVDKRMTVKLSPRNDSVITIRSALGEHQTSISRIKSVVPFQFVLTTLKNFQKQFSSGCDITIESEFSDKVGFASSAAVTVATLSAISAWLNLSMSQTELAQTARAIIRKVQGLGSGADVAACVFGGIIGYRANPFWIQKEEQQYPITVVYSGSKTPTVEAVTRIKKQFSQFPSLFRQICRSIDLCSLEGIKAVKQQNWRQLGQIMNIQQGFMDALGVNTDLLNGIVEELRQQSDILGAKISGSGLGDCIVAIGKAGAEYVSKFSGRGVTRIQTAITQQGVQCEKN